MDHQVEWSPEAVEDIQSIAEYIARDSDYYARAVVNKLLSTSKSISEYPQIGRVVPEIGNVNLRERIVYSYRLVYRVAPNRIIILAVIHGSRLLDSVSDRIQ